MALQPIEYLTLYSIVIIRVANDIFFWKRFSGLHFDDFNRFRPFTRQPMLRAALDEEMITVCVILRHIVQRYRRNTFDHDPMLITQLMTLITEAMPRLDVQPLHFSVILVVEDKETTPGSIGSIFVVH